MSEEISFNLIGDVSASEWDAMSQEDQEAAIESQFDGLTPSQIEEIRDTILRTIEQYKDVIKEYGGDLRVQARGRRGLEERAAEAQELLREIDDLKLILTDFEGDLQLVAADEITQYQTHNRDHSADDEFAVSQYEMGGPGDDPDENTYKFTLKPRGILLGDETGPLSDEEYLRAEEIVNERGEVIKDVKPDGILNYADIEEALKQKNDPLLRQKVFFLLKPDHTLSLERYNPEAGEIVFKVTDPEGNFAYFEFKNLSPETIFSFSSGVTEEVLRSWPESLLKQCRVTQPDGTTSLKSVHEILFPSETPEADRLGVIPGYRDTLDHLSRLALGLEELEAFPDSSINVGTTSPMWLTAQEILRAIFTAFDEGDLTFDKLKDVWREIKDTLLQGFSEEERSKILQAVVLALAKGLSQEMFAMVCGPLVGPLEDVIEKDAIDGEVSADAKLVILLLETKAGAGKYGGEAGIWNELFPDPALGTPPVSSWADETSRPSSLEALEKYQSFVTEYMLGGLDSRFQLILEYVRTGEDPSAGDDPDSSGITTDDAALFELTDADKEVTRLPSEIYSYVITNISDLAHRFSPSDDDFTGVSDGLREFFTALNNAGEMSVQEMRNFILQKIEAGMNKNVIAAVINILFIECGPDGTAQSSGFFSALIGGDNGEDWANKVYAKLFSDDMTDMQADAIVALGFSED